MRNVRYALEPLATVSLVAMKSVPKRVASGRSKNCVRQFEADPTLLRFGTDFIATRLRDFCSFFSLPLS
jgi:hypothetical protein